MGALALRTPLSGRLRLGHPAPRRPVCRGVWLRHQLRGARRAHRGRFRAEPRHGARARVDRGAGRRTRGLGLLRRRGCRRRQAAPAAGRPGCPREATRPATGRGVHRVRPHGGLPRADALDAAATGGRAAHLRAHGLRARRAGPSDRAVRHAVRSRRPGGSCSEGVAPERPNDTRRECHLAALM